jgi:hypothetical protein
MYEVDTEAGTGCGAVSMCAGVDVVDVVDVQAGGQAGRQSTLAVRAGR